MFHILSPHSLSLTHSPSQQRWSKIEMLLRWWLKQEKIYYDDVGLFSALTATEVCERKGERWRIRKELIYVIENGRLPGLLQGKNSGESLLHLQSVQDKIKLYVTDYLSTQQAKKLNRKHVTAATLDVTPRLTVAIFRQYVNNTLIPETLQELKSDMSLPPAPVGSVDVDPRLVKKYTSMCKPIGLTAARQWLKKMGFTFHGGTVGKNVYHDGMYQFARVSQEWIQIVTDPDLL